MPRGATPSRWCVCQFHHFGQSKSYLVFPVAGGVAGGVAGACAGGVVVAPPGGAASDGLFSAGGVVAGGVAGAVGVAAGVTAFAGTTDRVPGRDEIIVNASEVTMKMIAAAVVALESSVAEPR